MILLSFGGYGDGLDLSPGARRNPELDFVVFTPPDGPVPANVSVLPHDHRLPHQDLVLGADAVLAKPGYGTVTECLNRPTPLAYVLPDGDFREHPKLVDLIERWLPAAPLTQADLRAGRWRDALEEAMAGSPAQPPPENGLDVALRVVSGRLARGTSRC